MEKNEKETLIRILKIGEAMVNPLKIEDWSEQRNYTEQMLLALLNLSDTFIIEPEAREVIKLVKETKTLCMETSETLGEGYRKIQRDIALFSMYKRLGWLISQIEKA